MQKIVFQTTQSPEEVLAKETRELREELRTIESWAEVLTTESCMEVRMQGLTTIQNQVEQMRSVLDAVNIYLEARKK